MFCACCGVAEIDDIKLKECDGCDLVKYCGDACQELHLPEHAGKCRKRAAELRDELLFKQPESSHLGDCPICMIPLSLDQNKSTLHACCSKLICNGCEYTIRSKYGHSTTCPFCRAAAPVDDEENEKRRMKRVDSMKDPVAMHHEGCLFQGKGEYVKAFEWFSKAAELGYAMSHWQVAALYFDGKGGEKSRGKYIHHLEEAAIGGHHRARYHLGREDTKSGRSDRAVKHFVIAAKQGDEDSFGLLKFAFKDGLISKEDFASTLRAYQSAVEATKSPEREKGEKYCERMQAAVEYQRGKAKTRRGKKKR